MITAMMGLVSGLVSGVVPDVLKEVRETRDHKREVEFIRLQHELQMQRLERQAGDKIEAGRSECHARGGSCVQRAPDGDR